MGHFFLDIDSFSYGIQIIDRQKYVQCLGQIEILQDLS